MNTDNREDYLINILRLTEGGGVVRTSKLASFMNVAPASVTEMLRVLSEAGYVDYEKYKGVSLTEEGLIYAKNIRRKHHIMERFLTDVLDVDHESAHEEACRMEHTLSDDSANKICRIIGAKVDHDCSACTDSCEEHKSSLVSINDLEPGRQYCISYLKCEDASRIKKLISMGFVPGRVVSLDSKLNNGPRIVKIGNSVIAIDKDLASLIFVERKE